jgi:ribosome-interacting GTPase 1
MEKSVKKRKPLTKKTKIKIIVWAVILLAVAAGFGHQYYIHTDGYIKSFIQKNLEDYTAAAQMLIEKPTSSEDFQSNVDSSVAVQSLTKYNIEQMESNPYYDGYEELLEKVAKHGTQDIKSTESEARFYQSVRFVIIYAPDKDTVTGAESAGDGWFYIKSF